MLQLCSDLFDTSGFPPRWHCGVWSEFLGWTHILSDIAIFGAYTAIPCVLAFFMLRRKDIPFPTVLWLFVAFIFACGTTHLIEAVIFWHPIYRFAGLVKFFTAVVSWGTVVALVQVVPQVLHFPGLAKLNAGLRSEVEERKRVEGELRQSEVKLEQLLNSERRARDEAETANRIKDEFLSTVSHELRTPLNAILGYSQLLLRDGLTGEVLDGLTVIERNAKVQAQIIEDLLDMSRIVAGKVNLDVSPVDLATVTSAAIDTVRPAADAKRIRIETALDASIDVVLGDSARLQQVVWNLLSNAVKFTPTDGLIRVSLSRLDQEIELKVCDNGQGISADFLPFVFDRFRQQDPGTTRRHGGLGLGLSIVKNLVELHGGSVGAASDGESRGATFSFRLPTGVVSREGRKFPPRSSDGSSDLGLGPDFSLRGVRILVVDDEGDARELVKRLLTDFEAEVSLAATAEGALQSFRRQPPDVLLSDIGMPQRDGYDLIREIRSLSEAEGGRVPAAALTAFARAEDRKRAMLAGYQAHITKPIDPAELALVVAALTGRAGVAT